MKQITPKTSLLVLLLLAASTAYGGTVFTLNPVGGAIEGSPGQVTGWGFTFFNDVDFAVITASEYLTVTPVGTFVDFISVPFTVTGAAPASSLWTQAFNAVAHEGVGEYSIDPAATIGAFSPGVILITYDVYRVDPNDPLFDPDTDLISSGNVITADASVQVVDTPAPGIVPEPRLGLGVGALSLLIWLRRQRRS